MKTFKNIIILMLTVVFTQSCEKKSEIWFQNGDQVLLTEHQVDSVITLRNKKMQDKSIDMVFQKIITDTIKEGNKIVYKYNLRGESTAVTENINTYEAMIGKPLPQFSLTDLEGGLIDSSNLMGKPLVINLWFTKCPPCIAEMPELNKIRAEVANADVQFIAMTYEGEEKVKGFLEKREFNFQHIVNAKAYCEKFTNQYPINIFVNREGIIHHIEGGMPLIYDRKLRKVTDKVNPFNFKKALEAIKV